MFFERSGLRVFVYKSEIDMRCGFERLDLDPKLEPASKRIFPHG